MPSNKTQPTNISVDEYIKGIKIVQRREDAANLVEMIKIITNTQPIMWGSSIIGFVTYHYVYDTGREGDTPAVGFSARKQALVIYGLLHYDQNKENISLAKSLGPHSHGKGCIYIKKLSDINIKILEQMIENSFKQRNNTK
jgi:hypothetical protein